MVHVYRKGKKGKESSGIGPKEQGMCVSTEKGTNGCRCGRKRKRSGKEQQYGQLAG